MECRTFALCYPPGGIDVVEGLLGGVDAELHVGVVVLQVLGPAHVARDLVGAGVDRGQRVVRDGLGVVGLVHGLLQDARDLRQAVQAPAQWKRDDKLSSWIGIRKVNREEGIRRHWGYGGVPPPTAKNPVLPQKVKKGIPLLPLPSPRIFLLPFCKKKF